MLRRLQNRVCDFQRDGRIVPNVQRLVSLVAAVFQGPDVLCFAPLVADNHFFGLVYAHYRKIEVISDFRKIYYSIEKT